jgi:hypothetical protein
MELHNSTALNTEALRHLFIGAVAGWPNEGLKVFVRYSRGAEFSGSCYYRPPRIHINLGRRNRYPYLIRTHIARPQHDPRSWWRELYGVPAADASQLAFFIFMHEFYHWLVKKARRNSRQKEGRCDRFAVRAMVERWGMPVLNPKGRVVRREEWDFQDLDGFVAAARTAGRQSRSPKVRAMPVRPAARPVIGLGRPAVDPGEQLLLFAS